MRWARRSTNRRKRHQRANAFTRRSRASRLFVTSFRPRVCQTQESEPNTESTPGTSTVSAKLVLQREKKGRAGKTATRLRGLVSPEDRLHWAKRLKKELGCGATIEGDDVILLGDVGERARTRLEAGGFRRVVLGN